MTARYASLSDTTIRRHWEAARKVNIKGETVTLDPAGPLAEAAWAKQRAGRATQALPNGYCGLPMVKTCPHANACFSELAASSLFARFWSAWLRGRWPGSRGWRWAVDAGRSIGRPVPASR
jgi:hypothetical protein